MDKPLPHGRGECSLTEFQVLRAESFHKKEGGLVSAEVMSITGKGTVATGKIERGIAKTGDTIEIVGVKEQRHRFVL